MRLKTEKEVLATQAARLPGLPSSRVGLETVLGTDETIDFEDVLNGALWRCVVCGVVWWRCCGVYCLVRNRMLLDQALVDLHTYTSHAHGADPLEKPDLVQVPIHAKMEAMLRL